MACVQTNFRCKLSGSPHTHPLYARIDILSTRKTFEWHILCEHAKNGNYMYERMVHGS